MSAVATFLLLAGLTAGSIAHAQENSAAEPLPQGVVASVNGRPILQSAVDSVAQQIQASGETANQDSIIEELVDMELLTQSAEKLKLDRSPKVAAALQLQYTQTMANAYLTQKSAELSFTDEELLKEYDAQSSAVDRAEYRPSHILLDDEKGALAVISKLSSGESFETLAKEYSIDPTSDRGGDLGWIQNDTLPDELSQALAKMQVGETSTTPIETAYGYHILKLTDKRESVLPDFESVRTGITNLAVRKALTKHVKELRNAANVQLR